MRKTDNPGVTFGEAGLLRRDTALYEMRSQATMGINPWNFIIGDIASANIARRKIKTVISN